MSIMSSKSTFHHLNRFFILKPSITLSQTICIQCDFWICKAVETNHSFFSVQVCLLRFCEAMNVGQGGVLLQSY
ncbi:unnamed protein product [Brassica oleracea]|uniref:(rape) hypothetical protein n=1 Tax=Brassica napus TaxID=3708 RepID=A0A816JUM5_BRANA|nr:unnamed protein product [Brassica napus]